MIWTKTDPFLAIGADLHVRRRRRGHATILAVRGELDIATVPTLRARLDVLEPADMRDLILDLDRVDYIAAAGLRALLGLRHRVEAHDGRLCLVSRRPQIRRLLRVTDLDKVLPIFDSVHAARRDRP
ncbi:MAG TPA: anti-sigma factor antagonist [Streptosporangiaceae bacterium]